MNGAPPTFIEIAGPQLFALFCVVALILIVHWFSGHRPGRRRPAAKPQVQRTPDDLDTNSRVDRIFKDHPITIPIANGGYLALSQTTSPRRDAASRVMGQRPIGMVTRVIEVFDHNGEQVGTWGIDDFGTDFNDTVDELFEKLLATRKD